MLLVGIVLFAYPKVRTTHHDAFERTHRFLGWTATALVWCQVRNVSDGGTAWYSFLHSIGCASDKRLPCTERVAESRSGPRSSILAGPGHDVLHHPSMVETAQGSRQISCAFKPCHSLYFNYGDLFLVSQCQ